MTELRKVDIALAVLNRIPPDRSSKLPIELQNLRILAARTISNFLEEKPKDENLDAKP